MAHTSASLAWLALRDGTVLLGRGPFKASAAPPAEGVAFFVQDFALAEPRPWKIPAGWELLASAALQQRFKARAVAITWQPLDPVPFAAVFQEVMAAIHGGSCEKTVPVVTETGRATDKPGLALAAAMSRQGPPLQSYGWVESHHGFAGATPELLFSLRGSHLETMALAGTARSEDRHVFAVDEKEIREHEYVAQSLVSKLTDLGRLERRSREILNLGPIVHFLTSIQLELRQPQSAAELVARLHPTPALGPLPRTRETLAQLVEWRQRLGCPPGFGAPFGVWIDGGFEAVVAIRGVWWSARQLRIPAGCGIIEASRLVNEWRELRLKREAVKQFLSAIIPQA